MSHTNYWPTHLDRKEGRDFINNVVYTPSLLIASKYSNLILSLISFLFFSSSLSSSSAGEKYNL